MSEPRGPWEPNEPEPKRRRFPLGLWIGLLMLAGLAVFGLARLFPGRISDANDAGSVVQALLMVALVSALLLSTRRNLRQSARYAAGWLAIMAVLALGYVYRGELRETGLRLRSEFVPGYTVASAPQEMVITQGPEGHFLVYAKVNGQPVQFLVDTGASAIVLSPADARRLGLDVDGLDFARSTETANGIGRSAGWRADSLEVGDLRLTGVDMDVNQAPMRVSLLGMDFFRRLDSFRVEGGRLYMRWRETP